MIQGATLSAARPRPFAVSQVHPTPFRGRQIQRHHNLDNQNLCERPKPGACQYLSIRGNGGIRRMGDK